MSTKTRERAALSAQALLFPLVPPMPAEKAEPAAVRLRRAGHKRRLAEAAANAPPFVPPTLPCRHGGCRRDPAYRALPGRGQAPWCPGCPGHVRCKDGLVLCMKGEEGHPE